MRSALPASLALLAISWPAGAQDTTALLLQEHSEQVVRDFKGMWAGQSGQIDEYYHLAAGQRALAAGLGQAAGVSVEDCKGHELSQQQLGMVDTAVSLTRSFTTGAEEDLALFNRLNASYSANGPHNATMDAYFRMTGAETRLQMYRVASDGLQKDTKALFLGLAAGCIAQRIEQTGGPFSPEVARALDVLQRFGAAASDAFRPQADVFYTTLKYIAGIGP